jgi:hypothetical protein
VHTQGLHQKSAILVSYSQRIMLIHKAMKELSFGFIPSQRNSFALPPRAPPLSSSTAPLKTRIIHSDHLSRIYTTPTNTIPQCQNVLCHLKNQTRPTSPSFQRPLSTRRSCNQKTLCASSSLLPSLMHSVCIAYCQPAFVAIPLLKKRHCFHNPLFFSQCTKGGVRNSRAAPATLNILPIAALLASTSASAYPF